MRIQAGADGGAANGEIEQSIEGDGDAAAITIEEAHVAGKFLADGERCGVLQMGAADFHDTAKFLRFGVERVAEFFNSRKQAARRFHGGSDMHGGGKSVVGRLRHVHVVVGVNGLLGAHLATSNLDGAVRDDFIDVHVSLRATSGLPDAQGEVLVQFAGNHFVGGMGNQVGLFLGELAEIAIDERRGFLEDAECANEFRSAWCPCQWRNGSEERAVCAP